MASFNHFETRFIIVSLALQWAPKQRPQKWWWMSFVEFVLNYNIWHFGQETQLSSIRPRWISQRSLGHLWAFLTGDWIFPVLFSWLWWSWQLTHSLGWLIALIIMLRSRRKIMFFGLFVLTWLPELFDFMNKYTYKHIVKYGVWRTL